MEKTMGESSFEAPSSARASGTKLDSWKEIAAYLSRDVTTVQRWEKREGMPVHRHVHDKRGSVYALPEELDAWRNSRRTEPDEPDIQPDAEAPIFVANESAKAASGTRPWFAFAAIVLIGLLAVGWLAWRHRSRSTAEARIHSLAVLPLLNLSGDASQDYLADGITEALIGRLAGIHDLRVISHTSVMRFKNPQLSVPEIAKSLAVDALVEGSVVREGNHIEVRIQLIRAATDDHFWSQTFDREMQDALTLESELAQSIAERIAVTITGQEQQRLTAARPVSPEVYESYLKGGFLLAQENSKAGIEESIDNFNTAIKLDPAFAPAYLGLAQAYTELGTVFGGVSPSETRPKVIAAARKALELDPGLADAHQILAIVLQEEWEWRQAETEYRRALELAPNDAVANAGLSRWLLSQGRTDEAIASIERARELDPNRITGDEVASTLFQSHLFPEAIRESRSDIAVHPDSASALFTLGFALISNNQPADAVTALEKAYSLSKGSPAVAGVLIRAYAHAGRRDDALRILAELKRRQSNGYVPAAAFVNAYLGLGDNEQAFIALEQAYKEKSNILQFVKTHPYFDPIRNDPRFVDLVRRIGLS
jgi:TolB-like protein/Flp pilus assembly protein TadD